MNVPVRNVTAAQRLAIIDCDIHPAFRRRSDLDPFLPARWRAHMASFGEHLRQGLAGQIMWPRMMAAGMRRDAFPDDGLPGSDLALMRAQHLDPNGVEHGMLMQLSKGGMEERNLDFAAALSQAINDWQVETFVRHEPRLHAGIVVPQEDATFAAAEIERRAQDRSFAQVILSPRSSDPLGHRRYWPIYEAAARCALPLALHVQGFSGGHASTGSGWPTYYMQEHYASSTNIQTTLMSLIFAGVFERIPALKVVMIEGGFTWAPALAWRMDRHWERMRSEVPDVKRPPSEYLRQHVWFTTQPIEEPADPQHLADIIGWIGWDRVMFSSDYPHWDFDDPRQTFKFAMSEAQKAMVFRDNARTLYRLQ
jgi:predicted TIM-barrel fold metal-dependent hydrolase